MMSDRVVCCVAMDGKWEDHVSEERIVKVIKEQWKVKSNEDLVS